MNVNQLPAGQLSRGSDVVRRAYARTNSRRACRYSQSHKGLIRRTACARGGDWSKMHDC